MAVLLLPLVFDCKARNPRAALLLPKLFAISDLLPTAVLKDPCPAPAPTPLKYSAESPTATKLPRTVLLYKAPMPTATLLYPVVFLFKDSNPTAVLLFPLVVVFAAANAPNAVLLMDA